MKTEIKATYDPENKLYWVATYMSGKYIPCGRYCTRQEVEEMGVEIIPVIPKHHREQAVFGGLVGGSEICKRP